MTTWKRANVLILHENCEEPIVWLPINRKGFNYGILSGFAVHVLYTNSLEEGIRITQFLDRKITTDTVTLEFIDKVNEADFVELILVGEYLPKQVELLKNCNALSQMYKNELVAEKGFVQLNFMGYWFLFQVERTSHPKIVTIGYSTKLVIKELENTNKLVFDLSFCQGIKSQTDACRDIIKMLKYFDSKRMEKQFTMGCLLSGHRGTGKTFLTNKIADQSCYNRTYIKASELVHDVQGATEKAIISLFEKSTKMGPFFLILDDVDELFEIGGPFIEHLLLEIFKQEPKLNSIFVLFITNRKHLVPKSLISSSVLASSIELVLPTLQDRIVLMRSYLQSFQTNFADFEKVLLDIAQESQGFSCSDLQNILTQTLLKHQDFQHQDIVKITKAIQPSNLSGIISKISNITFDEVFGMSEIIEKLKYLVVKPFNELGVYDEYGVSPPKAILLHGISGVGKTALACALVNATGMSCIYVSSPSIRSKLVGQSEQTISKLFAQARSSSPCVLLMDQIEMLLSRRGTNSSSQGSSDRIVTTFLTEMDGIFTSAKQTNVFIIATSSNLDEIDPAITRPGRIDIHVHIPLPEFHQRIEILNKMLENMPNSLTEADINNLALQTAGSTSGDIVNMCREAAMNCIRTGSDTITIQNFPV